MGKRINGSGIGRFAGVDQGVDFTSKGLIPALANAMVTYVGPETDIEGQHGSVVVYKMLDGAHKGQYVYTAENFSPTVRAGQRVRAGQTIGVNQGITSGGTGIEIGFNSSPTGWRPVAPLGSGAAAHGPTSAGQQMWSFIQAAQKGLPAPSGSIMPTGNMSGGSGKSGSSPSLSGGGNNMKEQMLALIFHMLGNKATPFQQPQQAIPVQAALSNPIQFNHPGAAQGPLNQLNPMFGGVQWPVFPQPTK